MTLINPYQDFGLAGVLTASAPLGALVYVNSAANDGDDANDGLAPGRPKLTIAGAAGALSLCTDDADILDTIVVQGIPAETYPITIDRARVSVIGAQAPGFYPRLRLDARGDTEDVFVFESDYAFVKGFELRAGVGCAGIVIADVVHRCAATEIYFGFGTYGVHITGTPAGGGHQISHSYFQGSLTTAGVHNAGNSYHLKINNNVFKANHSTPAIGVHIEGAPGDGQILDNTFACGQDVVGLAITMAAGSSTYWIIAGNRANFGVDTMTANPYRDLVGAGATSHNWMQNYWGDTLTDPSIV